MNHFALANSLDIAMPKLPIVDTITVVIGRCINHCTVYMSPMVSLE